MQYGMQYGTAHDSAATVHDMSQSSQPPQQQYNYQHYLQQPQHHFTAAPVMLVMAIVNRATSRHNQNADLSMPTISKRNIRARLRRKKPPRGSLTGVG